MLQPKNRKYPKVHKGRNRGLAFSGNKINFGDTALQSVSRGRVTSRQIESARRAIVRHLKRRGKVWIRIFPDKPITKKPLEVRMGKGKGSVEYYVSEVQPGTVLFEIQNDDADVTKEALRLASDKLPVRTQQIFKNRFIF